MKNMRNLSSEQDGSDDNNSSGSEKRDGGGGASGRDGAHPGNGEIPPGLMEALGEALNDDEFKRTLEQVGKQLGKDVNQVTLSSLGWLVGYLIVWVVDCLVVWLVGCLLLHCCCSVKTRGNS